jgi:hypothetical protein
MEEQPNSNWPQPFTFGGVAALAHTPRAQLLSFQTGLALLAAVSLCLGFEWRWVPVVVGTIEALPATGAIERGRLIWPRPAPLRSGNSTFLCISVDPSNALEPSGGADLEVQLRQRELRFRSLFGFLTVPYPKGYTIAVNRNEIEPWWGAWHPAVTAGLGTAIFVSLFAIWGLLATVYTWPIRLISLYASRALSWAGAWRLGLAALLPGGLFLTVALMAYAFHQLSLMQLLAAAVLHMMIGWIYILGAPFYLPRAVDVAGPGANPFRSATTDEIKPRNPFAGSSDS